MIKDLELHPIPSLLLPDAFEKRKWLSHRLRLVVEVVISMDEIHDIISKRIAVNRRREVGGLEHDLAADCRWGRCNKHR